MTGIITAIQEKEKEISDITNSKEKEISNAEALLQKALQKIRKEYDPQIERVKHEVEEIKNSMSFPEIFELSLAQDFVLVPFEASCGSEGMLQWGLLLSEKSCGRKVAIVINASVTNCGTLRHLWNTCDHFHIRLVSGIESRKIGVACCGCIGENQEFYQKLKEVADANEIDTIIMDRASDYSCATYDGSILNIKGMVSGRRGKKEREVSSDKIVVEEEYIVENC